MKHRHNILTVLLAVTMAAAWILTPAAVSAAAINPSASAAPGFTACVSLFYTASVRQSGQGSLYWDYNQSGSFFYQGGEIYNQACLATDTSCRFTALTPRSLIAQPANGWYLDGFYTPAGKKLALSSQRVDIIRVTVNGVYFYDSVISYSDPSRCHMTKARYKETVKAALKALYGTSRYKVMETLDTYQLPKKTQTIQARFKKKALPDLTIPETLQKTAGDGPFYAAGSIPSALQPAFRSSSSKLLAVDRDSGLCTIKGEGIAIVTLTVPAAEKTLRGEWKIQVYISPESVSLTSAVRSKDKKSIAVKWKPDTLCSGYEIQAAADSRFTKVTAKKTAASGKTASTKLAVKKTADCRYLRIRPYKKSRGEKLYGPWTQIAVR